MNNQNNNLSNNQVNSTSKVAILLLRSYKQDYIDMKQSATESIKEKYGEITEIIEANDYDDHNTLHQLISLVASHDYTIPFTFLVEDNLISKPLSTMFAIAVYTLNMTKPIKIEVLRSDPVMIGDNQYYIKIGQCL